MTTNKITPGEVLRGLPSHGWNRHELAAHIVLDRGAAPARGQRPGLAIHVGKVKLGGITARSGTTLGSGTVILYTMHSGTLAVMKDNDNVDVEVTAYNLSTTAISADAYTIVVEDLVSGLYLAAFEDCP